MEVANDGDSILELWNSIDLNNSNDIGMLEWNAYVEHKFSILAVPRAVVKAFRDVIFPFFSWHLSFICAARGCVET